MTQFLQVSGGERGEKQVRRNVLDPGKQTMAYEPNATCFGMVPKLSEVSTIFFLTILWKEKKRKKKNMGQKPDAAQKSKIFTIWHFIEKFCQLLLL